MSIFSIIYLVLAALLLVFTMRSQIDILSMAAVCFLVYTMYCILGIGISGCYRPKLSGTLYYIVYTQILIILLYMVCIRRRDKIRQAKAAALPSLTAAPQGEGSEQRLDMAFAIYTAIMVGFVLWNIAIIGIGGFLSGKANVWDRVNIFYIIALYGSFPSFAYGMHRRKTIIWLPSLIIEASIFIAGARAFTATLIVIFLCECGMLLWKNRRKNMKLYILGGTAVIFLLIYRKIDTYIMIGDISGAIRILRNPLIWAQALEFNEPRVIIANYDYVLTQRFRLPPGDVIYRLVDFIPGAVSALPIKLTYPEYFSAWLQAEVQGSAGVGGTIWGESYAMFGIWGIFIFTLLWLSFVHFCNRHLKYERAHSCFWVALGTYLAWYINRLDFNRVGQVCKIHLLCYLLWGVIYISLGGEMTLFNRFKRYLHNR